MLSHIHIKNFATIENLEIEFCEGFTILTGETGAGKSILIDALDLVLGERADTNVIRHDAERCEISVNFDLKNIPQAKKWLQEQEMISERECIVRRIITQEGRSRSFINGIACPLQLVRDLGALLVNIHGQHEHQALLKRDKQRELLDNFANHPTLCLQISALYQNWREQKQELTKLLTAKDQQSKIDLLRFQTQEFKELALVDDEVAALEIEHKKLANAEHLISSCNQALDLLIDNEQHAITNLLHNVNQHLVGIKNLDLSITNSTNMINQAIIHVDEAANELRHYLDSLEVNSERLQWLENRLEKIYQIARKHHISPKEIPSYYEKLQNELTQLEHADEHAQKLEQKISAIETEYQKIAKELSTSRQKAAKQLDTAVTEKMQTLGMQGGKFAIQLTANSSLEPTAYGAERIEFMVSANAGQPLQLLQKVASGGELSRIGLAIQVISAQQDNTPTLIFDEVDVGIGGGIAEIVGNLLRKLGEKAQVLCVTHLPQVAAQGHQHLQVKKVTINNLTFTQMQSLIKEERVNEIARMLGGVKITEHTLAHAREMLNIQKNKVKETA